MVAHQRDPSRGPGPGQSPDDASAKGERVARALARAGVASRRDAERLIEAGRVALNGQVLTSPAVTVGPDDILTLDGQAVADREPARVWLYHKPPGLLTTHRDPKGRPTVFERLPPGMPRVISVGRLDLNSEGLLLLTNDGGLARELELPSAGVVRRYRARAFGRVTQEKLDRLKQGVTVDGIAYGAIEAHLDGGRGSNVWISLALTEGKNREVRKVLDSIGLKVNRLIRLAYGPFELGELKLGEAEEVPARRVKQLIEGKLASAPARQPRRRSALSARAEAGPLGRSGQRPPAPAAHGPKAGRPHGKPEARPGKARPEKAPKAYKAGWARPKPKARPGAHRPGSPTGRGKR
jgi:23S rRNA pseudouridine2605 synthase